MSVEWYEMIAKRNGGYRSNAIYTVEGLSGETVFETRLVHMLPNYDFVLDAGCGHGEFTLKMSKHTMNITGIDNCVELLKIAAQLKKSNGVTNVNFIFASTKAELPFEDGQFDLIYDRRGPTSILKHSRILRSGGTIMGIHSASLEKVEELLTDNGFVDIEIEEFNEAMLYFLNEIEFTKFLAASHGNPDFTLPKNRVELNRRIEASQINGRLGLKEWRYIWTAKKK